MKVVSFRLRVVLAIVLAGFASSQSFAADQPDRGPRDRTVPRLAVQEQVQREPVVEPSEKKLSPREMKMVRGDVYMARKMYIEAVAVYQDVLREEPRNAELLNKIGNAYLLQSRLGDAKKFYKRAIKADKTFANAVNNLGSVEYYRHKFKNAVKEFNRAIKLDPMVATYHQNLFHSYWGWKKYDQALLSFQRAVALDPLAFENRGSAVGPMVQSVPTEERAAYYFFMARAYAAVGDAERCALYLSRARDEGYLGVAGVAKDPAFASVVESPAVQAVLQIQPVAGNPKQ